MTFRRYSKLSASSPFALAVVLPPLFPLTRLPSVLVESFLVIGVLEPSEPEPGESGAAEVDATGVWPYEAK